MMCLGSSLTDWLSVAAYWVSAGAFIATAVGAWKAYSASRKTLEYTKQQLDMAKESREEERIRHRIATRDLAVSDMTKEMVEIMLVLFFTPLTFRDRVPVVDKESRIEVDMSIPHLAPLVPPEMEESKKPKLEERIKSYVSEGMFIGVYPANMYYHALNTLLLYDMIKVCDNIYNLTDVGRLMLGKLWDEMPYEEDFSKMYYYVKGVFYKGGKGSHG